jgi:hypothetical protein
MGMGELQGDIDDLPPLNDAFTEATLAGKDCPRPEACFHWYARRSRNDCWLEILCSNRRGVEC